MLRLKVSLLMFYGFNVRLDLFFVIVNLDIRVDFNFLLGIFNISEIKKKLFKFS